MENLSFTDQDEADLALTPSTLNPTDKTKAERRESAVQINQISPNERRKQFAKRPSMSADELFARKTSVWNINSTNLSSFMKLSSIVEAPQPARKWSSVRAAKPTDNLQSHRKISDTLLQRGMLYIHIKS